MRYFIIGITFISTSLFALTPAIEPSTNLKQNVKANAQKKVQAKVQAKEKALIQQRIQKVKDGSANVKTLGVPVKKAAAR